MSKLSDVKLVLGDREKSKNGKGTAVKKVYRKIAKKRTDVVGQLSTVVGNVPVVYVKSKVQQRTLPVTKGTVKKSITLSKKSSVQKALAATTERTPIKSQKSQPTKKRLMASDPNSATKAETKGTKPMKRISKAIPTTTTTIAMPRITVTSHRLDGSKLTKPAEKRPAKGVKRVLRKKLNSSLNEKIADPKTVNSIAVENTPNVFTKNLLSAMNKENNIIN